MNTQEMSASSSTWRRTNSGIATAEAISTDGEGKWEDNLSIAFANPTGGVKLSIPKDIDPEGLFKVQLAPTVEDPAPAIALAVPVPAPSRLMSIQEARDLDILLAQRSEIDDEDVKDVKVGQETLVMNASLMRSPDQLAEASEEVRGLTDQGRRMLQQISTPDHMGMKLTATFAPLIVPDQPANTDISPTAPIVITIPKLVEPALEPFRPQTRATVLEKDGESVEVPAQKRQAVEKDRKSTLNQAGPSSSDTSDNV